MSRITVAAARSAIRSRRPAACLVIGLILLGAQRAGQAADPLPGDALAYANGYLVTGNYVEASVDFQPASGGNGFGTGTINVSGVPDQADVLAAWLYWETIIESGKESDQLGGVQFRGQDVDVTNSVTNSTLVKQSSLPLTGSLASCYGSNGQHPTYTMYQMRADVRLFLPLQLDKNGNSTTKRLANGSHTVRLPDSGTGNHIPVSAGASLVVVYRDTNPDATRREPLRKVVIYDGLKVLLPGESMTQAIRGFYKSGPADQNGKIAKLTQIVGSAQPNGTDRMFFDNGTSTTPIATNPFGGTSNSSDRGWADKTVDVTSLMPGSLDHVNPMYGESVTTTVDHTNISPYDCLSWGAIVFSTTEADVDSDGLPDGLEDAPGGLLDADASPLPNLNAMTASSSHPDIFIEMTGMWTPPADPPGTSGGFPGTTYGSSSAPYKSTIAPYSPTLDSVTDTAGHNHLPTPEVIKALAQHFATSSFTSLNGTVYTGVVPHIDVGTRASYKQALNLQDADVAAITTYLVPDDDARGGDHDGLQETPCGLLSAADCTASPPWYKDYPGTVGWQVGYEKYALNYFDKNRNGLFHWLFYAHANGWPRSPLPCLDSSLMPTDTATTDSNGNPVCVAPNISNPNLHVPTSLSGVAQVPGSKVLITLGLWHKTKIVNGQTILAEAPTGAIIGTSLHELGHNLELYHGGIPPTWNPATRLIDREPQCKPDHLSIMSYLFQISGLLDDTGHAHYEYSTDPPYANLNESDLIDGYLLPGPPLRRRTAWFAFKKADGSNAAAIQNFASSKAGRFCNGTDFPNPLPSGWVDYYRVDGPMTGDKIDWLLDGVDLNQNKADVNFDGVCSSGSGCVGGAPPPPPQPPPLPLRGYNDWVNLRLDQTGGGKGTFGLSLGTKGDGGGTKGDGSGTKGDGTGTKGDGSGTKGDGSGVDGDGTKGDGSGTKGDGSGQDLTLQKYGDLGHAAPNPVTLCVIGSDLGCTGTSDQLHRVKVSWVAPPGDIVKFHVFRWRTAASKSKAAEIGTTPDGSTTTFVDTNQLPNGISFSYAVRAEFDDATPHPFSGASVEVPITAVNDAPVAAADANYSTFSNTKLTVPNPGPPPVAGVLANDSDVDSPSTSIKAVLVQGPMNAKQFTFNPDGSFTYTPKPGFFDKTDSFTYKANDGAYTETSPAFTAPMSPDSNTVTVTITVIKR